MQVRTNWRANLAFVATDPSTQLTVATIDGAEQTLSQWLTTFNLLAVVGHGRALPQPFFEVIEQQLATTNTLESDDEVVPIDVITHMVGPTGVRSVKDTVREDCVVAAELLRLGF